MSEPEIHYSYSRLCFKAHLIESLQADASFRVDTPEGCFLMTKSDFYRVFSNVVNTTSYAERGLYHYPTIPKKALPFLVK